MNTQFIRVLFVCTLAAGTLPSIAGPGAINPNSISEGANSRRASPQQVAQNQVRDTDYQDGEENLQAGNYALAEADFRSALAIDQNGYYYLGLAEALVSEGRMTDALQACYLVFHPGPKQSWGGTYMTKADLEYALLLNQNGQWGEAVGYYNAALPVLANSDYKANLHFDPSTPQPAALAAAAHIGLGLYDTFIDGESGSNARAFQEYNAALQLAPDWDVANYYYGYGWQHLSPTQRAKFGTIQQAKAHLQKAEKTGNASVKAAAQKTLKELG